MNEGSQTNLTTCDLFPVACSRHVLHLCYSSTVGATFEHLKICPNPVQNNSLFFSLLPEKENKKLKIEQSYIKVYNDNFRLPRYF